MKGKLLVLSGIGDIHWLALKMESFIEKNGFDHPLIYSWNIDNRPRSLDFIKRLPFITPGDYWNEIKFTSMRRVFNSLYIDGGMDFVKDFHGFDYFLSVNGSLRQGWDIDHILPDYETNWEYPLLQTEAEKVFGRDFRSGGRYILLSFSDNGMFDYWVRKWPAEKISKFITELSALLPSHRLILTGGTWDERLNDKLDVPESVENLTGKTNFDQLMGLIRHADGFVGWPGGNTILSTHLRVKTMILWTDYFVPGMRTNWVAPGRSYIHDDIANISPEMAALRFAEFLEGAA